MSLVMESMPPRELLDRLVQERREDYAGLSRLIGRNPAYIQQFIKRGTPKRLDEEDRRTLARYFGISEELLGGPSQIAIDKELISVPRLNVRASAGAGLEACEELPSGKMGFDARWLRELAAGNPSGLSMIRVRGDSMMPTLNDGDEIMVNRHDAADRLRDGIYVLRLEDGLVVKRVALGPIGRRLSILSDNKAYPSWENCDRGAVEVIGRVVWAARRFR